jgi:hypothetical protein
MRGPSKLPALSCERQREPGSIDKSRAHCVGAENGLKLDMLEWVRRWGLKRQKKAALREYVHKLGLALANAYGREETYSVGRIKTALRRAGLTPTFERHAIAMFATKADFMASLQLVDRSESRGELYENLRHEVATLANHGSYRFMPRHWEDIGMDNGDNAKAASRWGVGL